ncbi:bacterial transcriptional activator domain-containing protein [Clostridium lacusfryxellense]|uniref:bacterial transcriptional activator domain-containing protein n=1 Tax=Clostridium lacusfryxellense TaxID=205328 RepID=UPI001C0DA4F4|nr:bacterial transcriptional activator domain-containing protein [Clostridium lacusfryxellense]MBU3111056.1 bacterial transcriptional activator domain-containing protein [Clostridium lacusfryxellense]
MLANKLNYAENAENADKDCIKIYTLGSFEVKSAGNVLSNDCKRSQQLWNLFKYILTYRNKRIVQENFSEILWSDKECANPVKALQNLVYRLRMLLDYKGVNKDGESIINYSQGCYSWNKQSNYWTDVDEFEDLYKKAKVAENNDDSINAIELYQKALKLYKGDYLSEDSYNEWIMPVRNYYHRIYIDIIAKLTKLLKHYGRSKDILKICEEALMIQPFEESLHLFYIEALIEVGNMKQAQKQYEYVTSMLYEQMGVKPSTSLRNLYQQIKCNDNKVLLDFSSIEQIMTDRRDSDGAFFCDADTFISVYKLESRRAARTEKVVFMGMLTISRSKDRNQDNRILTKEIGPLLDMLIQNLREGDVVSEWSKSQILVLLSGTTFDQANKALARILNKYEKAYTSNDIKVEILLKSINCAD